MIPKLFLKVAFYMDLTEHKNMLKMLIPSICLVFIMKIISKTWSLLHAHVSSNSMDTSFGSIKIWKLNRFLTSLGKHFKDLMKHLVVCLLSLYIYKGIGICD
jgi:hypothetical protein